MGVSLRARARLQINLAVSQVVDIKQVATFPDIIFPIMWFEDVSFNVLRIYTLECMQLYSNHSVSFFRVSISYQKT